MKFSIDEADRVEWDWFSCRLPKIPEDRCREVHWMEGTVVRASSDSDWDSPDYQPIATEAAVAFFG